MLSATRLGATAPPPSSLRPAPPPTARIHHPDKGGDAERFKRLGEAFDEVRRMERRRRGRAGGGEPKVGGAGRRRRRRRRRRRSAEGVGGQKARRRRDPGVYDLR